MKTLAFVLVVLAAAATHAEAPPGSPQKLADIKALLAATGHRDLSQRELTKLIESYQRKLTRVNPDTWSQLRKSVVPGDLDEAVAKVYDRHLSHDEVKAALAFYETEAGRKLARVTPLLMEETAQAVAAWQRHTGNAINQKLNESVKERDGGR